MRKGQKMSEEVRQRMIEIKRSLYQSRPELKNILSEKLKGNQNAVGAIRSEEYRVKMAEIKKVSWTRYERYWATKYGISIEEVRRIRVLPCGICGKIEPKMELDHDHKTGNMRGMLCIFHNRLIGMLESPNCQLEKALDWLKK